MFAEDLSAFFNTAEHAVSAVYDGATDLDGILSEDTVEVLQGDSVGVSDRRHIFTYEAALISPAKGVSLVIGSDTYTVRDFEVTDGIGQLILEPV